MIGARALTRVLVLDDDPREVRADADDADEDFDQMRERGTDGQVRGDEEEEGGRRAIVIEQLQQDDDQRREEVHRRDQVPDDPPVE